MRPIPTGGALVIGLALLAACADRTNPTAPSDRPLFAQAPADGNGNKVVIPFDLSLPPVDCGTQTISFNTRGWVQIRVFGQPANRNVELDVFHGVLTFANAAGKAFVWHDVGPDHYYVDDGDLIVSISGTSTASGNIQRDQIVIGHVLLNLTTGEVEFVAGNQLGKISDLACDALT
jgi:hypothetical protein